MLGEGYLKRCCKSQEISAGRNLSAGKECTKTVLKLGMHLSYTVYLNSFPFGLEQNIYINSFLSKQIEAHHP